MKTAVKTLSLIVVFAILLSMAACTSATVTPATTAPSASTAAATSANTVTPSASTVAPSSTSTATDDFMSPYKDAITMTTVGLTYDQLDAQLKGIGETFDNSRWVKLIKDRLNIDIKYNFIASGQYDAKVKAMIAANNLPDFFRVDPLTLSQLITNDQVADLTTTYNQYMGPYFKSVVEKAPSMITSGTVNGKIMGIGADCAAPYGTSNVLWLRYDWMKKLGLSEPKNMDDLYNIAKAFKDSSLDGVPVTAAYTLDKDFGYEFNLFCNAYHAYPGHWVVKDGQAVYGSVQPEMVNALTALAKWYKDGLINAEFLTTDFTKGCDDFVTGKSGMFSYTDYLPLFLSGFNVKHPDSNLRAYPMVSADSSPCTPMSERGTLVQSFYVVKKDCQHPEALMKMYNLTSAIMYGDEAKDKAPDGTANNVYYNAPANASDIYNTQPTRLNLVPDINLYRYTIGTAVAAKDPSLIGTTGDQFIYDDMIAYVNGDQSQWGWYKSFCTDYGGAFALKYYSDNKLGLVSAYEGLPTDDMNNKMGLIDSKLKESFAKIIMGQVDASTEFANYVKSFESMGGTDITQQVNTWYQANKGN